MHTITRIFLAGLLAGSGLAFPAPSQAAATPSTDRVVYLAGNLSDEALIRLGSAVGCRPGAVLLLDSAPLTPYLRHFLAAYRPTRLVPVGSFPDGRAGLEQRLGVPVETPVAVEEASLWTALFPAPERIVLCPDRPRRLLLRGACLAGAMQAPLWVCRDRSMPPLPVSWRTRPLVVLGSLDRLPLPGTTRRTRLRSEQAIEAAHRAQLGRDIATAVVTNPHDLVEGRSAMSPLAPWLAVMKRAALVCTGPTGTDAIAAVARPPEDRSPGRLDTLILAASLRALPVQRRPNPIPEDRDPVIEMEPWTPTRAEPFSYAVGRLFHEDRAVVPLMLARQRLLLESPGPRRALVASNPGGGLPLLEAFSRTTAGELSNAGYQVTGLFGRQVNGPRLRRHMVGPELVLWEGHHNTLVKDWGFTTWEEPLPATFVFLQSCLALQEPKVQPLLSRGAFGVLGTSTRTYSASGGALSLAFFNAVLYDGHSLGGSLRQAKNFLLAYARLKEKRLGDAAARTGANYRAAWAFTLWGDPTFHLPRPEPPARGLPAVRHQVRGNRILIDLPAEKHDAVASSRYRVQMRPNSRLAGLLRKADTDERPLVPFVFVEVHLPGGRAGQTPRLRTNLPSSHWHWLWDARRRTGYLLATPRPRDGTALRFRVEWPGTTVVGRSPTEPE